ncbi:hypothetical protein AB0387_10105 [Streptomyces sp. NPDC089173]|uniref:hypothetical protein n=1 Tax=Streptomyces sp. NPDC089173 TaxID=3154965 RepID=UPI00345014B7
MVLGAVLAGAVLISGVGLRATDSGPGFLGERMLRPSGSERTSTESAAPGSGGRTATCTVSVASSGSNDSSGRSNGFHDRLTLTYGPVPEAPEKRREWIDRYFSGSASPLPDALDGLVASDRAMLILPEACDAAGRPSAVTLWGESWSDGAEGRRAMPLSFASLPDVSVGGAARTCEAGGLHPPG